MQKGIHVQLDESGQVGSDGALWLGSDSYGVTYLTAIGCYRLWSVCHRRRIIMHSMPQEDQCSWFPYSAIVRCLNAGII